MLKYLAKISMDIFPSVLATIIGAYIVNHYINAKPAPDTPSAAVAPAATKKNAKPAEGATDVANLPVPGIKAKGIAEKAVSDKAAQDKPAAVEAKPAETAPAETAAATANPRIHQPAPREKTVAKATTTPAEANPAPASNAGAATPDANDLARAAIERLRKSPETKSSETKSSETKSSETASQETARAPEAPRVATSAPQALRPLPPPITVSSPASEAYGAQPQETPPYTASVGADDPSRPTPPADIPVPMIAPPLDLRADATAPAMPRAKGNVADDMLSGVKSMFHAVLPKAVTPD